MSNDSEILGRRTHSPRTLKIPKHQHSEGNWYSLEPHDTLGIADCQHSVQQGTTNIWISDNKNIRERNCDLGEIESMIIASRNWNGYHPTNGKHEDLQKSPRPRDSTRSHPAHPKTVEDIEKWLKTRADPTPTMDHLKPQPETVDRYLNADLSSTFLEKDVLSIDEKLTLSYDSTYDQFQELHSEKYLEVCGKDGFILPEFQLDNLDPLTLANNDMMVAGEILPSTSTQPEEFSQELKKADEMASKLHKNPQLNDFSLTNPSKSIEKTDFLGEQLIPDDDNLNLGEMETQNDPEIEENPTEEEHSTSQVEEISKFIKVEPRNMKKRRKLLKFEENNLQYNEGDTQTDSKDGIMAVVAISTDKISNMTQIVINTGKEEQIYQGKTSELMEATGYFPEIPKFDGWGRDSVRREGAGSSHEAIITDALEELGFSEETLISMALTATENGKTWVCPREDCRREFNRLYALKGHLLAHYGVRPFKCDFEGCTWAFHSDFKLKRHKETHLKRKDYVCQVAECNRRFTTVYNLWTHQKLHSRPNRIACNVPNCIERFQTKRALEIHMKSHDQEHAPYVCSHPGCGKRYYSSNALTSHQRCHSYKDIDIKCGWTGCGKIFDKPCRLKAHVRCHTGSKPYSCTYQGCEWAFSSSSKLKRHEKKHTNERKFLCDMPGCNKAFMRSEHLKEHRLTHKAGRFFQCYMCDARFSAKSSLYVHIKKHQNRENNASIQNRSKINSMEKQRIEDTESVKTICEELSVTLIPSEADVTLQVADNTAKGVKTYFQTPDFKLQSDIFGDNDFEKNDGKLKFQCSVNTCGKIYASKSSLRSHIARIHGHDESIKSDDCPESETLNYVFYECQTENCDEQMIDAGGVGGLSQPESPIKVIVSPGRGVRRGQGAARTGLTCDDVWRLKKRNTSLNSVGPTDVVLGGGHLGEGLLLSEELPSMFYQDELASECQIMMLEGSSGGALI